MFTGGVPAVLWSFMLPVAPHVRQSRVCGGLGASDTRYSFDGVEAGRSGLRMVSPPSVTSHVLPQSWQRQGWTSGFSGIWQETRSDRQWGHRRLDWLDHRIMWPPVLPRRDYDVGRR